MTNNIEQIEEDLTEYGLFCMRIGKCRNPLKALELCAIATEKSESIFAKFKSMQSQIDALTKEADADESRESESL